MPAGLLGAGLLLCVEGGQVNRKGISGGMQGGGSIMWEVYLSASTTGD